MAARGLGTAYQQAGRAADARAAFERALTRRNTPRGLQTIYNNLGTLAMYDADYGAARRSYEQALAAAPRRPTRSSTWAWRFCRAAARARGGHGGARPLPACRAR